MARPCPDDRTNWDKEPDRNVWAPYNNWAGNPVAEPWDPANDAVIRWDQPLLLEQQPVDAPPVYHAQPRPTKNSLTRGCPQLLHTSPDHHILVTLPRRIRREYVNSDTDSDAGASAFPERIQI